MTLLFAILILTAFALWFLASLPGARVPEWSARAAFLAATAVWFVMQVTGTA